MSNGNVGIGTMSPSEKLHVVGNPSTHHRSLCYRCLRPTTECYCRWIVPFSPEQRFVILLHPDERRRGIATGRMTSLCLTNALLIEGFDFSNDHRVNQLLMDPAYHSMILFPHERAISIDRLNAMDRQRLSPPGKVSQIFILDGSWPNARKMLRRSPNLQQLPAICFQPVRPSQFQVRRQPREYCYSTIEAVHHTLKILDNEGSTTLRPYDNLLDVFAYMVQRQVDYGRQRDCPL